MLLPHLMQLEPTGPLVLSAPPPASVPWSEITSVTGYSADDPIEFSAPPDLEPGDYLLVFSWPYSAGEGLSGIVITDITPPAPLGAAPNGWAKYHGTTSDPCRVLLRAVTEDDVESGTYSYSYDHDLSRVTTAVLAVRGAMQEPSGLADSNYQPFKPFLSNGEEGAVFNDQTITPDYTIASGGSAALLDAGGGVMIWSIWANGSAGVPEFGGVTGATEVLRVENESQSCLVAVSSATEPTSPVPTVSCSVSPECDYGWNVIGMQFSTKPIA